MKFGNTMPILRSFDESKAKKFYIDFLEFNLDWEHRFKEGLPPYICRSLKMGVCYIFQSITEIVVLVGAAIRIETDELEHYHQLLMDKEYKNARPGIQEMPWGGKY